MRREHSLLSEIEIELNRVVFYGAGHSAIKKFAFLIYRNKLKKKASLTSNIEFSMFKIVSYLISKLIVKRGGHYGAECN
jgi:hypothetical protein